VVAGGVMAGAQSLAMGGAPVAYATIKAGLAGLGAGGGYIASKKVGSDGSEE